MSEKITHILNTDKKASRLKTLCGLIGGAVYNPTQSNCPTCIERFKERYPGSYEAWLRKVN